MRTPMQALLIAIGRQLRAEFLPIVGKSLPSDLEYLLARLVAIEAGSRGSTESAEVLQAAVAQPRLGS